MGSDDSSKFMIGVIVDSSGVQTGMENAVRAVQAGRDKMVQAMQSAVDSVGKLQNVLLGLGGALAGGFAFAGIITKTTEWADGVELLSKKLGISTEDASILNVALEHVGITAQAYAQGAQAIARALAMNSKAFQGLDIDVRNSDGTFKNSQEIMQEVIQKLGDMKAGTDRNVAAFEIMKRTHMDINALLRLTGETMDAAAKKAESLGLVMNEEGMARAIQYKLSMNDLKLTFDAVTIAIGSSLIPALTRMADSMMQLPRTIRDVYTAHEKLIDGVTAAILAFVAFEVAVKAWSAAMVIGDALATATFTLLGAMETAVAILTGGFWALSAAEMFAAGGWVVVGLAAIDLALRGVGKTFNDVADAVIILVNALGKLAYSFAVVFDLMRTDLRSAIADFKSAAAITVTQGTGKDWYSQAKNMFKTPDAPKIPKVGTGDEDAPTLPGHGGKSQTPYEQAKGQYDAAAAKAQYEAEQQGYEYMLSDKLKLYQQFLADVDKQTAEQADYDKGFYELSTQAYKQQLDLRRAQLQTQIAEGKIGTKEAHDNTITLLDEELAHTLKNSKDEQRVKQQIASENARYAQQQKQWTQQENDLLTQSANDAITITGQKYQAMYDQGLINNAQLIALQKRLEEQRYSVEMEGLRRSAEANGQNFDELLQKFQEFQNTKTSAEKKQLLDSLLANTKNKDDLLKLWKELEQFFQQHAINMGNISKRETDDINKNWKDLAQRISGSLDQAFQGIIKGTMKMRDAVNSIGDAILSHYTQIWAKSVTDYIFGQQQQVVATQTTEAAKTATVTASTATQTSVQLAGAAAGLAAMFTAIVTGFTALFAAMQSVVATLFAIPVIGPVLGVAAEVAIVGGMAKLAGLKMPSFDEGSMDIVRGGLAMIHPGEKIITAKSAAPFNDFLMNGALAGSGSGAPVINLNYNAAHYGRTDKDVKNEMRDNAKYMVQVLGKEWRQFNRKP